MKNSTTTIANTRKPHPLLWLAALAVSALTAASDAPAELVYWNKLGSLSEVLSPVRGGAPVVEGDSHFEPGVYGGAYAAPGAGAWGSGYVTNRIIHDAGRIQLNPEAGTIEAWVNYPRTPIVRAYHYSMYSMLDGPYQGMYDPTVGSQAQAYIGDGTTGELYKMYVGLYFGNPVGITLPSADTIFTPGSWHHLAMIWDRNGIDGSADYLRLYVDGSVLVAGQDNNWGNTPDASRHTLGKGAADNGVIAYLIDNVKVWDNAEANFGNPCRLDEDYVALDVAIDIKPGSDPNSINLGSKGNVPVAIFSTDEFDATTVNPLTVTLANAGVRLRGRGVPMTSFEDVNRDGLLDIILHVDTGGLDLAEGAVEAKLLGQTFDAVHIRGVDAVRIIYSGRLVPEPGALSLLLLGALALVRRRR